MRRLVTCTCLVVGATALYFQGGSGQQPVSAQVSAPPRPARSPADSFARTLEQAGRELAATAALVNPAVVHIESTRESRNGILDETGSGVIMSSPRHQGLFVVTNRHVVAGAQLGQINIILSDGRMIHPLAKLEDPPSDVAVLRIGIGDIEPVQWGDSDNLDIGHFVMAMGSPFGLSQSVTLGIISAKGRRALELPGRRVINQDFLQTDAAINPGNSGGPLIDLQGRLVGINTAIASQGGGNEGIGFSIPSTLVRFVVEQLLEQGRVRRGYLGVELDQNFDYEAARRHGLDRLRGAHVTKVFDETPAQRAGIRVGDVILNFDGFEVEDENDLINRVSLTPVNKTVRLIVLRRGERIPLQITLTERAEDRSALPDGAAPVPPDPNSRIENTGLSVLELTDQLAVQLRYRPHRRGVIVCRLPSGAEREEGLRLYDVIERVGRVPVDSAAALWQALDSYAETDTVILQVRRIEGSREVTRLIGWRSARRSGPQTDRR